MCVCVCVCVCVSVCLCVCVCDLCVSVYLCVCVCVSVCACRLAWSSVCMRSCTWMYWYMYLRSVGFKVCVCAPPQIPWLQHLFHFPASMKVWPNIFLKVVKKIGSLIQQFSSFSARREKVNRTMFETGWDTGRWFCWSRKYGNGKTFRRSCTPGMVVTSKGRLNLLAQC